LSRRSPQGEAGSGRVEPAEARANRLLLSTIMQKHGFVPYEREWWHFRLDNEPFPDTYFDFPVK
jgi:D-alanyl-D-alanine dipeptidase